MPWPLSGAVAVERCRGRCAFIRLMSDMSGVAACVRVRECHCVRLALWADMRDASSVCVRACVRMCGIY